jgi:glucose-1-phosphate cytidylyltransferase
VINVRNFAHCFYARGRFPAMKVVLFCGGRGLRMNNRDGLPKPLAPLGQRPILWHLMKYYAHYGHKDFILCLGDQAEKYKEYFLNYDECLSNDFVWSDGGRLREPLQSDIFDWRITFVDTGRDSNLGERLLAVRRFLRDEEHFLANYADGLTDCPLPYLIRRHLGTHSVATMMVAPPAVSFHFVEGDETGSVSGIRAGGSDLWVNAGFFVLRRDIFQHLRPGEELVEEPFRRLIQAGQLSAVRHRGFWQPIDTQKDLLSLTERMCHGAGPWEVWKRAPAMLLPRLGTLSVPHVPATLRSA